MDIARPTKSALLFTQQVGRGLRLPPGCDNLVEAKKQGASFDKQDCIVLDVTDNSGRHSLVTLNTLFGLPANMDLKGQSVVEAGEKVAAVLERAPSVDLEAARSLFELGVAAERIDLFEVKWPQEVLDNSDLRWQKRAEGHYYLTLPEGEKVEIFQDLVGKWDVKGCISGNGFHQHDFEDLPAAFRFAQAMLHRFGRFLLKYLRREHPEYKEPASKQQWATLRMYYPENQVKTFPSNLTKGEAKNLIDRWFMERASRMDAIATRPI